MGNHNKNVSEIIGGIKEVLLSAKNQSDLREALLPAVGLGGNFTYRHTPHWIAIALMGLITLLVAKERWYPRFTDHYSKYSPEYAYTSPMSLCGFVALITALVLIVIIVKRRGGITKLSKQIARMDALYDNGFDAHEQDCGYLYAVQRSFREFDRGNYSRRFIHEFTTLPDAEEEAHYYQFEYVDKRERTVHETDSNGRTTTRTETTYDYFYRFGLIFNFALVKNIVVASNYLRFQPSTYSPASIAFNKTYSLGAEDDTQLSRFLKPAVVDAFVDIKSHFLSLNVEINEDGLMCISFNNDDVVDPQTKFSLDQPAEFYEELKLTAKLPKLMKLMEFYQTLKRHSDNNFQPQATYK